MRGHGVGVGPGRGGVRIFFGLEDKAAADGIGFDVAEAGVELVRGEDLALVKAAHPDVELAFEPKGEASLDVLHGFLERDIERGGEDGVEVVGHDDEGVQEESVLGVVVEDGGLQEFGVGSDLEETAALRGYGGDEVRAGFLRGETHVGRLAGSALVWLCEASRVAREEMRGEERG